MTTILEAFSNDLADVSERVLNSLVRVQVAGRGAGAGTIWHPDGLILTNAHVVGGQGAGHIGGRSRGRQVHAAGQIQVALRDGRLLPARLLAQDERHDLAALRVEANDLTPIDLGDSRRLRAGDMVVAMGFPFGVVGGATSGIVIGAGAELPELGDGTREWIAAGLHLRPGHSGGPMVDSLGRLVGINTLMTGPDVGIAVPVHVAVAFLKQALGASQPDTPPARTVVV